jgi:hypothetical protein
MKIFKFIFLTVVFLNLKAEVVRVQDINPDQLEAIGVKTTNDGTLVVDTNIFEEAFKAQASKAQ